LAKLAKKEGFALTVEPSFFSWHSKAPRWQTRGPSSDTLYAKVPSQPSPNIVLSRRDNNSQLAAP